MATANFLKLRGLPFSATEIDVLAFLEGLPVWNDQSVIITINNDGRPSGEAFVKLEKFINVYDLHCYNGRYIGNRFIEVFSSNEIEFYSQFNRQKMSDMTFVRLRGLPYDTTIEDIYIFFSRLMIAPDGVGILIGPDDIPIGEAFVQFMSRDDTNMALQRHNQCIRSRYIEVYKSTYNEAVKAMEKQYDINKEEILKRARNISQNFPTNFRPSVPFPTPSEYYGQTNYMGGPMRHNRDSSKGKVNPYGSKSAPFNVSQNQSNFTNPNQTTIFMRGLPYTSTEQDIYDFFAPLQVAGVKLFRGTDGRLTGEAEAEFLTPGDALVAMEKDRCKISWRYIELFSRPPDKK